jgi:hypothetical protein
MISISNSKYFYTIWNTIHFINCFFSRTHLIKLHRCLWKKMPRHPPLKTQPTSPVSRPQHHPPRRRPLSTPLNSRHQHLLRFSHTVTTRQQQRSYHITIGPPPSKFYDHRLYSQKVPQKMGGSIYGHLQNSIQAQRKTSIPGEKTS